MLVASLLDVVRDQQHAGATSPPRYDTSLRGTPLKIQEPNWQAPTIRWLHTSITPTTLGKTASAEPRQPSRAIWGQISDQELCRPWHTRIGAPSSSLSTPGGLPNRSTNA